MKLNEELIEQLGNTVSNVMNGASGDLTHYFFESLIVKMGLAGVERESIEKVLMLNLCEEPELLDWFYVEGNDTPRYKVCELYTLHLHKYIVSQEDWIQVESDIDQVVDNCNFIYTKETRYPQGTNTTVILNHEECVIYEEISNPQRKDVTRNIIIGAIPSEITIHQNPFISEANTYEITWETLQNSLPLKQKPLPLSQVHDYLKEQGLILNNRRAKDIVSQTLFSKRRKGEVTIDNSIAQQGIYYLQASNQLIKHDIDINNEYNTDEETMFMDFLEDYAKYFKGSEVKLGTILKWGWIAPYSFVIKQLEYEWFPWLYLYGTSGAGKTEGYGYPTIYMYGKPDDQLNVIGGSSIDSVARLGHRIKQGTKTILVNEPGALFKNPNLKDMIKNCITSKTGRGKFFDYNNYSTIPAYACMFITSNHPLENDESLRRRFININVTRAESRRETNEAFRRRFKPTQTQASPLNILKVFSSYLFNRLTDEIELLSDWKYCIDSVLEDFYHNHEREVPAWLVEWYAPETLEDMDVDKRDIIREWLHHKIISTYVDVMHKDVGGNPLSVVLDIVVDSKRIPWLEFKSQRGSLPEHELAFSKGFVREVQGLYEEHETLKSLGELLGWRYNRVVKCFNGTGIVVGRDDFLKFVFPNDLDFFYQERYPVSK